MAVPTSGVLTLEKIAQENQANADTAMGILPGSKLGLDEPRWID